MPRKTEIEQPDRQEFQEYLQELGFEVTILDLACEEGKSNLKQAMEAPPAKQAFICLNTPESGMYAVITTPDIPVKLLHHFDIQDK